MNALLVLAPLAFAGTFLPRLRQRHHDGTRRFVLAGWRERRAIGHGRHFHFTTTAEENDRGVSRLVEHELVG